MMRPGPVDVDSAHRTYAETRDRGLEAWLLRHHEPLAVLLAHRFSHRGEPADDLRQVALLAMLRALRSYDPDRGVHFSTYAVPSVVGALKRHFRDHAWLVRPPRRLQETYLVVHEAAERLQDELGRSPSLRDIVVDTGLSEDDVIESLAVSGGRRGAPLEAPARHSDDRTIDAWLCEDGPHADEIEDRVVVADLVGQLSTDERDVITLSFFAQLTQKQIATRLGTSQSTVSRTRRAALDRLRALHERMVHAA